MSASDYLELELLDHVFGAAAYSAPANVYFSLHSADPGEDGSNELSGNNYARVQKTNNKTTFTVAAAGQVDNDVEIAFPAASGDWSEATHFGVWDGAGADNFLVGGALDDPKTVQDGDTASFAAGDMSVTMA